MIRRYTYSYSGQMGGTMHIKRYLVLGIIICLALSYFYLGTTDETKSKVKQKAEDLLPTGTLSSPEDINLRSDNGSDYVFTYKDEDFYVDYWTDHWIIYNSYRITNSSDIVTICKALSDEHPIHGKDMESYRTPQDMAFEWEQHNLAYQELPEDNAWREHAKDVDLDPEDQGRTFKEIYEDRTGRQIDLDDIFDENGQIKDKVKQKLKEKLKEKLGK